jgi:predicted DNA-binding transcriptional regulator YafY
MTAEKAKIIRIMEILQKTDESYPLTAAEIGGILEDQYGIMAERKSICRDIHVLCDECGMDIVLSSDNKKGYFLASRTFEDWELKLLIDLVMNMYSLPKKERIHLIQKIEGMASCHVGRMLKEITLYLGRDGIHHAGAKLVIDRILSAIKNNHKVAFQYQDRQSDGSMALRRNGQLYIVNPYALIYRNNFYYLVGNYDKYENLGFYRLDRIGKIMETDNKRKSLVSILGRNTKTKMQEFINHSIYNFIGDELELKIAVPDYMLDDIMDSFSEADLCLHKIPSQAGSSYSYEAQIKVVDSEGLYYWLLQRADHIKVLGPEEVRHTLIGKIKAMLRIYAE